MIVASIALVLGIGFLVDLGLSHWFEFQNPTQHANDHIKDILVILAGLLGYLFGRRMEK